MSAQIPWLYLLIAGLFEVGWAIGLKYTDGFSRLWPSLGTVAAMIVSLTFLGLALKDLPVGTAYAVWTGIGAVGTVILGHRAVRGARHGAAARLRRADRGRHCGPQARHLTQLSRRKDAASKSAVRSARLANLATRRIR